MTIIIDGTNGISGVDGTAANPAVEGTDANTGLFYPAADTVALATNGTERMRVDSSGNMLVGTTTQSTGAVLTVNGSIKGTITSGTAVASTSGTTIDFTSLPSWAKRITVMFNGVSLSGTSYLLVQIGAGSVTSSGYASGGGNYDTASTFTSSTSGFVIKNNANAALSFNAIMFLTNINGNNWVSSHNWGNTSTVGSGAGNVSLSGSLDRVRITTVNGTDTFDAGTINILYEG